jgi:Gas vesicle protein
MVRISDSVHAANLVNERSASPQLIDVLDRVLDKGIIVTYDINFSVVGLHVVTITGNVVIASIETYRRMTDAAVVNAQRSPALSHAVDEFVRRVDHGSPGAAPPEWDN